MLDLWQQLLNPNYAALIAAARDADPTDVASVARLRKLAPPALVNLALDLSTARRKLKPKWPLRFDHLIADPHGAEMASSHRAAAHKAKRFVSVLGPGASVLDFCCGIGADAIGLAEAGLRVLAIDADPLRAWMCGRNAGCEARACDVLDASIPFGPFHLDPSRRETGTRNRLFALADHQPPPEVWRTLIERHGCGCIKLGPGVDAAQLAPIIPSGMPHALEFLSERGRLTQATLWLGPLALGLAPSNATLLTDSETHTLAGSRGEPPTARAPQVSHYLIEPDDSIERAGLLGTLCEQLGLHAMHPGLGLLMADSAPDSPFCACFEVLAEMRWSQKHVKAWLREHDGGIVEIKTRAGAVNPDTLQHDLRGKGATPYTLFVLRMGDAIHALITHRVRK